LTGDRRTRRTGAIVGSIVGFVVGFMGVGPALSIAIERPAFRDNITDNAMVWSSSCRL
jgi:hypothetical protein